MPSVSSSNKLKSGHKLKTKCPTKLRETHCKIIPWDWFSKRYSVTLSSSTRVHVKLNPTAWKNKSLLLRSQPDTWYWFAFCHSKTERELQVRWKQASLDLIRFLHWKERPDNLMLPRIEPCIWHLTHSLPKYALTLWDIGASLCFRWEEGRRQTESDTGCFID